MRLLLLALLGGCASDALEVTPRSVPMSGYVPVVFDLTGTAIDAADVHTVTVGGVRAYALRPDGPDRLEVHVQGAPRSGLADVVLTTDVDHTFADALTYRASADPLFDRFVALGASLTQGVQGGVPTDHAQLHSPARRIAEQAGAYLPMPLLVPDLFPTIGADDLGPAPDCAIPDVALFVAEAAIDVIASLEDEGRDRISFDLARVDPDQAPHDVAVGGSAIHDLVHPIGDDFVKGFMAKLVFDPYSDILETVATSQLTLVEDLEPTLIVSFDAYGNDLIGPIMLQRFIDDSKLPPSDQVQADMEELVERLAATGAEVFLANMPRATLLPATADKRRVEIGEARERAIRNGADADAIVAELTADIDARIAAIEAATVEYNAMLDTLAGEHANVHVVDFGGRVAEIELEPLQGAGETLTIGKMGGLLSTDGVHFSDAGYAMFANLFLDALDDELGIDLERIDLDDVVPTDPYAPSAMRALGFDPDACTPP